MGMRLGVSSSVGFEVGSALYTFIELLPVARKDSTSLSHGGGSKSSDSEGESHL